jgi:hypothetical protein
LAGLPFPILAMSFRTRLLPVLVLAGCGWLTACSASKSARQAADVAEADRLYRRANDYVTRVTEGDFSYSYIQFYWKDAQYNVDRILRDYPDTPVGRQLRADQLKLGPFELGYFRTRVLPWLEVKRLGAFDPVNCAIFLYDIDESRWDPVRLAAFSRIIEVLARQKRWSEALIFPILPQYRPLLLSTVFRVAARFDQTKIVHQLLTNSTPAEREVLFPIQGEEMAIRGVPRPEIVAFLNEHPQDPIKLAVLSGMIQRELVIRRAAALRVPLATQFLQSGSVENPQVRDDVDAVARQFFPAGNAVAASRLAAYHAALGDLATARRIAADAGLTDLTPVHLAYLDYLAAFEKFDELAAYPSRSDLNADEQRQCRLAVARLLARSGRTEESWRALQTYLQTYTTGNPAAADAAVLQWFRGRIQATNENLLEVRSNTFADLPIKDPCVMADAIMEWSLAPDHAVRGASPWDAVVYKYSGGFVNLPAPRSRDVQRAAAELPPY